MAKIRYLKNEILKLEQHLQQYRSFPIILNLVLGIAMLVIGKQYDYGQDHADKDETGAVYFMIVAGSCKILGSGLEVLANWMPSTITCDDKLAQVIRGLCHFAYLGIIIWGSVIVFGKYHVRSVLGSNLTVYYVVVCIN